MAFIEKKDPVVLNIKLTTKGRELLSTGELTFKYFAIGDGEIDYAFNNETGHIPFNSNILRPADVNPSILSFIPQVLSGDPYNIISSIPSTQYIVTNPQQSIGFFTSGTTAFNTDSNHVKQPDAMVEMSGVTGGKQLKLVKAPTYGASGEEPAVGDLVLVKWTRNVSTTGHTLNKNYVIPFLMYQIVSKTGTLAANTLIVTVDRDLPNFSGYTGTAGIYAGALIYYNFINFTGATIFNTFSTDYLDEAVLTFLQNSQCPTVVFPFWNMTIIFTDEIAGVQLADRKFSQFNSVTYGGFVSYIQNQAPVIKKLGVIHYTNSSPANVYGEGFYLTTPMLEIPTIMWHKSTGTTLGTILRASGSPKLLTGVTHSLDTEYYDLADPSGNIVGKVFTDLEIFVIEDQELLYAMSYKSNRSWTLPDYFVNTNAVTIIPCPPISGGTVVTWTTPLMNGKTHTIDSQYYRHAATTGWTSFPSGSSISLNGVTNTGYMVCFTTGSPGGLSICARDYINSTNICTNGTGGASGSTFTTSITNVNSVCGHNYFFGGCFS